MKAQDVKKGMRTEWWVALEDAKVLVETVRIKIEHTDGGQEIRTWDFGAEVPIV